MDMKIPSHQSRGYMTPGGGSCCGGVSGGLPVPLHGASSRATSGHRVFHPGEHPIASTGGQPAPRIAREANLGAPDSRLPSRGKARHRRGLPIQEFAASKDVNDGDQGDPWDPVCHTTGSCGVCVVGRGEKL